MSPLRADEPLPAGRFGPTHYCRIHRHLFQDVYRWAGKYRTIATSKGGNLFCRPQFIEREMTRLFGRLNSADSCWRATGTLSSDLSPNFFQTSTPFIPFERGMDAV